MEPTASEIRVLGCLIEKQRTTPDAYPLSLNALRLACNQATNRDPVVEYDDATVRDAVQRLSTRRWARLASRGGRATKYRQLFDETVGLDPAEMAILTVMMLRGPQTPGELKGRSERLHPLPDLAEVHDLLDGLIKLGHVAEIGRRAGQKEARFAQTLGGGPDGPERAPEDFSTSADESGSESRLDRLERDLAELRAELAEIRSRLPDSGRLPDS